MGGGDGRRDENRHLPRRPLAVGSGLATAASEPSRFRFDPARPVPTVGGNISVGCEVMPGGAFDQRCRPDRFGCGDALPLAQRHDVLVFQTGPLAEPDEVTGPIAVRLWASSSAVDTDFTAKLVDVYPPNEDYPDGYAMNLVDSIVRARYRESHERGVPREPNRVYEFLIQLYPTSNLFAAGHRIRVDVSSSNYPRFDVNPNTGDPLGRSRRWVAAENSIDHDGERPSRIVLPIVPIT
jgi:uncharacterized protein